MHSQDDQDKEIRRREQELRERENAIRLRELEAEINQPPLHQTAKHQEGERSVQRWYGKLANAGKFLALVVAVVIAIKVASTLAYVILVGTIAWVTYELFFNSKRSKR